MKVSDIMTEAAVIDAPDDSVQEASAKMWQQQTGSLLVTDGDRLIGIVTERDVLRTVAEGRDVKHVSVRDAMTEDPVTIGPEAELVDAANVMFDRWFRHLPVVTADGGIAGVLSLRDILGLVAAGVDDPKSLQAITGHRLARDVRLERVEAGDLD